MGQKATKQKKKGLAIAGTTSAITTGVGIGMMVIGGPVGIIAGGIVLGAGISGSVNTVQQGLSKKKPKFDYKRWGISGGVGAAGGAIASPIAAGGAHIITSGIVTSAGARIGVTVATDVVCGVAAGSGTRMINNAIDGRPIHENLLTTALVGGVTGAFSAGAGAGIGQGIR